MTLIEYLFYALHIPIIPAWTLLIFAPRHRLTRHWVHSGVIPLILAGAYTLLLGAALFFGQSASQANMTSLPGVLALFSHPVGALTAWAHFLAYDLFVGAWIARDADRLALSHKGTAPILILALVFAPIGMALHLLRRRATGVGLSLGLAD